MNVLLIMASFDAFTYCRPLQGRNIRLLQVTLGSKLSTLEIRLIEKNLDEAEFEALSYVWGNQARKELIKCNGCWLSIGSNLHDALCERRRRGSTAFLWADATSLACHSRRKHQGGWYGSERGEGGNFLFLSCRRHPLSSIGESLKQAERLTQKSATTRRKTFRLCWQG